MVLTRCRCPNSTSLQISFKRGYVYVNRQPSAAESARAVAGLVYGLQRDPSSQRARHAFFARVSEGSVVTGCVTRQSHQRPLKC